MKNKDYINAIEKLNAQQISFYNSKEYIKYRRDQQVQEILRNKNYSLIKKLFIESIKRKGKKLKERLFNRNTMFETNVFYEEKKITEKDLEEIRKKKKIVYSCIVGEYDSIIDPIIKTENTDYVLYTDKPEKYKNLEVWKVREFPNSIKEKCNNNPIQINRYIKMHPKELFPQYDYAIYVDGNINIISDLEEVFIKSKAKTGLGMHLHAKRNDTYEEALYCMKIKKGNTKKILELIKDYKNEKFPMYYGLCEACVISIDLNNSNSKKILDDWWKDFNKRNTMRDQLSFSYVLWKNKFLIEEMGILGYNIEINPKFRKVTHNNLYKKK